MRKSLKEVISLDEKQQHNNHSNEDLAEKLPHQIHSILESNHGDDEKRKPFVNEHGVVIGDSFYDSPQSPLNQWSIDTDPAVMAGEEWVHPTNDIGFNSAENADIVEENIPPKGVPFMHPTKDVSYGRD
jgi:hypothetical protein